MSSLALAETAIRRRSGRNSTPNLTRTMVVVIAVLVFVLVVEIVFHLLVAPRLVVRNLEIVTDSTLGLDRDSLLTIAELGSDPFFFAVDVAAIASRLQSYPLIKSAAVERVFPDTLRIHVTGRKPLALALVNSGASTIPVAFDAEGVVFQIGMSVEELDLPVVSGLTFSDVRLGQRIARPLADYLRALGRLREHEPMLFSLISELEFVKKDRSGFEVVLYPKSYPVRVLLGSDIDGDMMKRVVLVLDVLSREGFETPGEIDFRTDEIVMRMRGE
jgi:cell division protein FtsQ